MTGTAVPLVPVYPGSVHTPTLRGWTPKLLRPHKGAQEQAACLTPVHTCTCQESCLARALFVSSDVLGGGLDYVSRIPFLDSPNSPGSVQKPPHCLFFPSCGGCPRCKSVPVTGSVSSSLLSLSTTSSSGVNFALTRPPFSPSVLSLCPLLSHRLTPQNTVTSPLSRPVCILACISCSLCFSLLTYCKRRA